VPEGIFGGLFDQNVHFRDSRHAAEAYGYNKASLSTGTPRFRFQYFVRVNYNPFVADYVKAFLNTEDQQQVLTSVKSITMPSMQMDTEVLNEYNKKRVSQTRLNYTPVTLTMHDTVEGRSLRMWEMYYEYYFKDGVAYEKLGDGGGTEARGFFDILINGAGGNDERKINREGEFGNDIIEDRYNDNTGYNLARVGNEKYLINSIDIFQVHGGRYSRTTLVNPRISAFNHDTLDYEDASGLVQLQFEFQYESVVYANVNERLTDEELEKYRYGDFWEMANLITIRTPVRGRSIEKIPLPNVDVCNGVGAAGIAFGGIKNPFFSAVGDFIGERNLNRLSDSIGGVVGAIPDAIGTIASASIFGGEISFNPDPLQALRTTGSQVGRSVINRARGNFGAAVASTASQVGAAIISGVFSGGGG
jgi:hypothetical protein